MQQQLNRDDLETVVKLMDQVEHLDAEITYMQVSRQGRNIGSMRKTTTGWEFTAATRTDTGDYYGR